MVKITLKGSPINIVGQLPEVGQRAPDFELTDTNLEDKSLKDFEGKFKILNIVPSLDTSVCATSAKKFNQKIIEYKDVVVLNISNDLPFAAGRFCTAEGLENIVTLSQMRNREFGKAYGVEITTGPLTGILSRAVVLLDKENKVVYTQQVPEITEEPNYEAVLEQLIDKNY